MDTGGNGIERNDREPGQQTFDKGFASAALRRVGDAMNSMEQLRCGDRRNREVLFGVFFQLGL
jgi:hypothetical protein